MAFGPIHGRSAWLLQQGPMPAPSDIDVVLGLGGSAVGAFLSTLLIGAIVVALAPGYVERLMDDVTDDPVGTFVYGVLVLGTLVLVTIVLVVTIVGILVAFPLLLLAALVWAVGAAIAFLAIADRLVDRDGDWLVALVVAAAINGGLALTGIGGLVSFCVGAAGFGAVLRERFG